MSCLTKFLQIIVKEGLVLHRWCNAVNIMIEKDQGHPKITDSVSSISSKLTSTFSSNSNGVHAL
jgi:hypothetical protein